MIFRLVDTWSSYHQISPPDLDAKCYWCEYCKTNGKMNDFYNDHIYNLAKSFTIYLVLQVEYPQGDKLWESPVRFPVDNLAIFLCLREHLSLLSYGLNHSQMVQLECSWNGWTKLHTVCNQFPTNLTSLGLTPPLYESVMNTEQLFQYCSGPSDRYSTVDWRRRQWWASHTSLAIKPFSSIEADELCSINWNYPPW